MTPSPDGARPPSLPLNVAAASAQVDTPFTRALQRRKKRGRFLWIPLLFGAILVGGVAVFFVFFGKKKLEGTLEAVVVSDATLEPQAISESMMGATQKQVEVVLGDLQKSPLRLGNAHGFTYEVASTGKTLRLRVDNSDTTALLRVAVRDNATLRDFLNDNAAEFNKPRERELAAGLKRFLEGSAKSLSSGGSISTQMQDVFQQKVAANLLVGGAGYNLIAVVQGNAYLCLYEDKQGRLYFPLPRGTKKFTLKGRELAGGTTLFPGNYTVQVSGTARSESAKKSVPETEKTDEDP